MVFLSFNEAITPAEDLGDEEDAGGGPEAENLPLRYTWVIWQQLVASGGKALPYGESTRAIDSFNTVSAFWKTWSRLPQPSELIQNRMAVSGSGADGPRIVDAVMVFRDGVEPAWEDAANADGGHFQFLFKGNTQPGQLDEHWNNLVLGVVGATIEPVDMITGVRLVDKLSAGRSRGEGHLRIEVWFNSCKDQRSMQMLQRNVERCVATRTLQGRVFGAPPRAEVKNHCLTRHQ